MNRRTYLQSLGFGLGILSTDITSAASDNRRREKYRPGGPWPGTDQAINLNGFHTNAQLTRNLQQIARQSERTSLKQIGQSAGLGAPIWEVTIGNGDTDVHLITQIHGDEAVGTEVALKVLQELAHGNSRQVEEILDALTLTIIPRVNPDGAMFEYDIDDDSREEWVGRRTNTQDWTQDDSRYEPYYHYVSPQGTQPGYDMNRDFNIRPPSEFNPRTDDKEEWWFVADDGDAYMDMPYEGYTLRNSGLRLAPEVRAVTDSYIETDPDIAITHHHQGQYLVPDSGNGNQPPEQTIMSVMAAYGPAYRERAPFNDPDAPVEQVVDPFIDAETSTRSLRLNALVANALGERGNSVFDTITRYGYLPLWGSYLDTVCPYSGAAGMLYEVSYQTDTRGHMALGRMMQATKIGFLESFEALANGSIDEVNEEDYFDLPLHGEYLENPHENPPPR